MRELWTTTYGFPLSEEGDGGEPPTSNALQLAERKRRSATVVELEKDEHARAKEGNSISGLMDRWRCTISHRDLYEISEIRETYPL